jgi:hypothetical protein
VTVTDAAGRLRIDSAWETVLVTAGVQRGCSGAEQIFCPHSGGVGAGGG